MSPITDLHVRFLYPSIMPTRLERRYDVRGSHFITCSCYQRRPLLDDDRIKLAFLNTLEETRKQFDFCVYGYVLMPEHFHLLISSPEVGNPGKALQVLKQRVSHQARKIFDPALFQKKEKDGAPTEFEDLTYKAPWQFWQRRFYDFNVRTRRKSIEKLKYIHRNPVVRGLVARPDDWPWSSFRHYATGEIGPVEIESNWTALRRERAVNVMKLPFR